jgi:hypothetical protein
MFRLLTAALFLLCASAMLPAQEVDFQKMVQDTQRVTHPKGEVNLIWWIPDEYWDAAFKKSGALTAERQKEFIATVDDYLIFAVVEAKIGPMGGMTGVSKQDLLEKVSVHADGQKLTLLDDADLSPDVSNLFKVMKPMLANMLGQFGEGMQFIVFKGKDAKGKRYADPRQSGSLVFNLADAEFKWRLPLGCFLPSKYDVATGEEFPGNYEYSPYSGKKLVAAKPAAESKH